MVSLSLVVASWVWAWAMIYWATAWTYSGKKSQIRIAALCGATSVALSCLAVMVA